MIKHRKMAKELTLDEQLVAAGITIPADTTDEMKELLVAQIDKANALAEQSKTKEEQVTAEFKKLQAKLGEVKTASGFGSFEMDGKKYDIVLPKIRVQGKDSNFTIVTADELKESKEMQAEFVKAGYGIVQLKKAK